MASSAIMRIIAMVGSAVMAVGFVIIMIGLILSVINADKDAEGIAGTIVFAVFAGILALLHVQASVGLFLGNPLQVRLYLFIYGIVFICITIIVVLHYMDILGVDIDKKAKGWRDSLSYTMAIPIISWIAALIWYNDQDSQ